MERFVWPRASSSVTEVITPGWLEEMVGLAVQPRIGAVGARLWYPNNTLQHGGITLGINPIAGHSHKGLSRGLAGPNARALALQTVSAVTGACLLVRKSIYEEIGGLDEVNLPVAYNDVDFCLKVREAGYRNVWTPHAELYHHEGASRGHDDMPEKRARFKQEGEYMKKRWADVIARDPYTHRT
jgi:GT2 family glycosyltransferase